MSRKVIKLSEARNKRTVKEKELKKNRKKTSIIESIRNFFQSLRGTDDHNDPGPRSKSL